MLKIMFLLLVTSISLGSFAQLQNPVKWSFMTRRINVEEYELHLVATIEKGWHIYSQSTPEGGPLPTTVIFSKNPIVNFSGVTKEMGQLELHYEALFGVDVKQYSNRVEYVQPIKLKGKAKTQINGAVEFMVCNDKQCLPPQTTDFSIPIK